MNASRPSPPPPPRRYKLAPTAGPARSRIDYPSELNPQQLEVVMAPGGPMLVLAGPGSGKTRTVTYRMARLIESGEDPARILLLTFTNKAASEMLRRAQALIHVDVRRVWGGTFHHAGNLTLRRHARWVDRGENYSILDREDAADLLDTCVAEGGIDSKGRYFPKGGVLQDILSFAVNTETPVKEVVLKRHATFADRLTEIKRVYARFEERKAEMNVLDFDDLLVLWLRLLEERPDVRKGFQEQFRHVLVDEYQDTNRLQSRLIDILAGGHGNLMVVGDDAQSIYSFRGADFANFLGFPDRYPDARTFRLESNYRSTPEILRLANESISVNTHQFKKRLRAERPSGGGPPAVVPVRDVLQQADFVCQRVLEVRDEGFSLNEIGVLYRAHFHSMEVQMEFTRRGIPFEVRSGLRFFEQRHVKDATAHLKVVVNPRDEIAWKRVLLLMPGVGKATAHRFWLAVSKAAEPLKGLDRPEFLASFPKRARDEWRALAETLKRIQGQVMEARPAEMIRQVLDRGYRAYLDRNFPNAASRTEDIEQLARFAENFGAAESFLSELALLNTVGSEEGDDEATPGESVVLSSIHQAKGLEWRVVFIIWLAEDRFPSGLALREDEDDEEERRLFYVAVTRAKEELYLCYPLMELGHRQGGVLTRASRFLGELPESVYEQWAVEETLFHNPVDPPGKAGGGGGGAAEREGVHDPGGAEGDDWVDEHFERSGPRDF